MTYGPNTGPLTVPPAHHEEGEHEPVFTGETLAELERIMARYPTKMAALLPALWMLQDARGWVS